MNLSAVNLNLLVSLDALLEERNVTRAGRRLGLSQPAMSAALKQLRALFDDPLLVSGRPDMKLTPRAEALRRPLKRALGELSGLLDDDASAFDPAKVEAEVRICATDYASVLIGASLCERIQSRAPTLRVRFGQARGYDVHEALEAGEHDLFIGAVGHRPGFRWEVLFHDEGVCVVRQGHPALVGAEHGVIDPVDFLRFPQMHLAVYRRHGSLMSDAAAPEARFTFGSHLSAFFALGQSDAVALTSRRLADQIAPLLDLECLALPGAPRAIPVMMSWHQSRENEALLRWVRDQVLDVT
ncbi:MAG: LysR family transcriptional regulator, partial [Myxococcota bacterium]